MVQLTCCGCQGVALDYHCGLLQGRKNGSVKIWGEAGKDRDDFSWLLCTNRQAHEQEKLMLTQIIAGDSLLLLGRKVHEARALWNIPQCCGCPMSKDSPQKTTNGICKVRTWVYVHNVSVLLLSLCIRGVVTKYGFQVSSILTSTNVQNFKYHKPLFGWKWTMCLKDDQH